MINGARQKENESPDHRFLDRPVEQYPKQHRQRNDENQGQAVTDVHRAEKISFFTLKFKIADWAALVHAREKPKN